jgi:cell division protein FtsN
VTRRDPKPPGEVINPPSPTPGEDVDLRAIVRFAIVLAAVLVMAAGIIFVLMQQLGRHASAQDPTELPPPGQPRGVDSEYGSDVTRPDGGVRLQRQPFADLEQRRHDEDHRLDSYGWVDRQAGVVRLPIEEAKRALVQRGLPVRPEAPLAPAMPAASEAAAAATPRPTPAPPRPTRRPTTRPAARPAEAAPAPVPSTEGGT